MDYGEMKRGHQDPKELCFSAALLAPLLCFLTAQQRRLRKMYLSDYSQELRAPYTSMIRYKNSCYWELKTMSV